MRDDSLYEKLIRTLKPGDIPRTAAQIAQDFDRSEQQAKRVLDWMTNVQKPPTMTEVAGASPRQWKRR